jgi:hypothetical protein
MLFHAYRSTTAISLEMENFIYYIESFVVAGDQGDCGFQ